MIGRAQKWLHYFIRQISTSHHETWTPDIQLYNSAAFDMEIQSNIGSYTKNIVSYDGHIVDAASMIVKSTCKIDVTWFPFDEQKCILVFGSWSSSSKYVLPQTYKNTVDADFVSISSFFLFFSRVLNKLEIF